MSRGGMHPYHRGNLEPGHSRLLSEREKGGNSKFELKLLDEESKESAELPVKRGRGRPKGSVKAKQSVAASVESS
jgi:hypothetical protein